MSRSNVGAELDYYVIQRDEHKLLCFLPLYRAEGPLLPRCQIHTHVYPI